MGSDVPELFLKRPESIDDLVAEITPGIYLSLKTAIELGKWTDGQRLDNDQLEYCMQAVILYEASNLPAEERTGFDLPVSCSKETLN